MRFGANARTGQANALVDAGLYSFRDNVMANTFLTVQDGIVFMNAAQRALTAALPPAASVAGRAFYVTKIDRSANPVTIRAATGELIDGLPTLALANPYDHVKVASRGSAWHAIVRIGGSPGPPGAPGINGTNGANGVAATPKVQQSLTGTFPGTGPFVLPDTPNPGTDAGFYLGERLKRVASAPGIGEYTIAGANVTTGFPVQNATDLWFDYYATPPSATPQIQLALTGTAPGTGPFTIPVTPVVGTDALYHRELRLKRVGAAPGIGEYTISGAAVTTGFTVQALGDLWADCFV